LGSGFHDVTTGTDGMRFTRDHEWVRPEGGEWVVGITDYAQDSLGDIVFVDLPQAGRQVAAGEAVAEVESTKTVASVLAPGAGEVTAVNGDLPGRPETVNADPFGAGWFFRMRPADPAALATLMDEAGYRAYVAEVSR
jgi:glycine cleavage system H protein